MRDAAQRVETTAVMNRNAILVAALIGVVPAACMLTVLAVSTETGRPGDGEQAALIQLVGASASFFSFNGLTALFVIGYALTAKTNVSFVVESVRAPVSRLLVSVETLARRVGMRVLPRAR